MGRSASSGARPTASYNRRLRKLQPPVGGAASSDARPTASCNRAVWSCIQRAKLQPRAGGAGTSVATSWNRRAKLLQRAAVCWDQHGGELELAPGLLGLATRLATTSAPSLLGPATRLATTSAHGSCEHGELEPAPPIFCHVKARELQPLAQEAATLVAACRNQLGASTRELQPLAQKAATVGGRGVDTRGGVATCCNRGRRVLRPRLAGAVSRHDDAASRRRRHCRLTRGWVTVRGLRASWGDPCARAN